MACLIACFIFIHRCIGFIWRTSSESTFPSACNLHSHTYMDFASKCDSDAIGHSYGYTYCDADSRRDFDSLVNEYPNSDAESDSNRYADCYRYPNLDSICNSNSSTLADGKSKRARYSSCTDLGSTVSSPCIIEYTNTGKNSNTRSFSNVDIHCHVDSFVNFHTLT